MKERKELLKSYLKRLGEGEELERVRADFTEAFRDVDPTEIMQAEQEMLAEGTPLEEVQRLCDVHAALFREKIAESGAQVDAAKLREERTQRTQELTATPGHPLHTFARENEALERLLHEAKEASRIGKVDEKLLGRLRELAIHYAKKGDLLYPVLNVRYGISGPSDVMWSVDDEIRDELNSLSRTWEQDQKWFERFEAVLQRAEDMIYKENNILFPNCAVHFTQEEWAGIYQDAKDYANCLGVEPKRWEIGEARKNERGRAAQENEVVLVGGHLTLDQLEHLLNTVPIEITFVDGQNVNRYFNEGPKVFKRPTMAIDREVFSCHPPRIGQKVRRIIEEFRAGTMDEVPIWMDKNGRTMLVRYMAVRDRGGKYIGTAEFVQDMEFAKEHFTKRDARRER